eukprot:364197-Chlamydomonas_euryale.AAC.8
MYAAEKGECHASTPGRTCALAFRGLLTRESIVRAAHAPPAPTLQTKQAHGLGTDRRAALQQSFAQGTARSRSNSNLNVSRGAHLASPRDGVHDSMPRPPTTEALPQSAVAAQVDAIKGRGQEAQAVGSERLMRVLSGGRLRFGRLLGLDPLACDATASSVLAWTFEWRAAVARRRPCRMSARRRARRLGGYGS